MYVWILDFPRLHHLNDFIHTAGNMAHIMGKLIYGTTITRFRTRNPLLMKFIANQIKNLFLARAFCDRGLNVYGNYSFGNKKGHIDPSLIT